MNKRITNTSQIFRTGLLLITLFIAGLTISSAQSIQYTVAFIDDDCDAVVYQEGNELKIRSNDCMGFIEEIDFHNLLGQVINGFRNNNPAKKSFDFPITRFRKGYYVVSVRFSNGDATSKKVYIR